MCTSIGIDTSLCPIQTNKKTHPPPPLSASFSRTLHLHRALGTGKDSHKVKFDKFVVTKVERIQNKRIWDCYNLKKEMGEPHKKVLLAAKAKGGQATPQPTALSFKLERGSVLLDPLRNEHLLFHGAFTCACVFSRMALS